MIKKEEVYKIGLFNKPHGIHGELQFTFTDDIFDRVDCDYLICLLDGIFVPFFIEEYRFRSDSTALVKLEGIDTAERARMFTNIEVYFPVKHAEEAEDGELSWNFFIGFQMEDIHHGPLGEVIDVDTTTVNTLFVVEREEEELLVPAQEEFIVGIDQKQKLITVELPEGLLNLEELDADDTAPDKSGTNDTDSTVFINQNSLGSRVIRGKTKISPAAAPFNSLIFNL